MSAPLIVVTKARVKEGKLEEHKQFYKKISEIVAANEPRIIAFHGFLNDDGTEFAAIQVHPDTASMAFHMQVLKDNWDASYSQFAQMVEVISVEYYGTPPESALEMDGQGDWGNSVKPIPVAGFIRSAAG